MILNHSEPRENINVNPEQLNEIDSLLWGKTVILLKS